MAKIERLDEYLGYLKLLQRVNKKSFLEDYHNFGLAERYLQLTIEVTLDIAKMLVTERGLPKPESNQEFFAVLHDAKILSKKTTETLQGTIGFRNVLVHDYEKIDRAVVYEKLQTRFDDFLAFRKEVLKYLKKQ